MQTQTQDYAHIKGWAVDADPENDPAYPMKRRTNLEHAGYTWDRPAVQHEDVEVLHSNERPNVTATFGESTPPSGLSGMLRRFAFRYSESNYGHWLPLMLADRVNMVEGVVSDLLHGRGPRMIEELGWRTEWKHNRAKFVTRMATYGALLAGTIALIARKRR